MATTKEKKVTPRQKQAKEPASGVKKKTVSASNTAKLDAKNPIPLEYNSKHLWITNRGKGYIPFLNPTDTFAQLLLEAKLLSPTNFACVTTKAEYCLGNGVFFKNAEEVPDFTKWAASVNRRQQTLNEIVGGAFDGFGTWGNSCLEVVRGEIHGTRFLKVYKRNFLDCRLSDPDDDDIPTSVLISKEFRKNGLWNLDEKDYFEVPIWSPNMFDNPWVKDSRGFEHTIFHLKNEVEGYDYYGMPSNVACLPQQILEYKAARFNIDNFDNNLVIGGTIVLRGNISDEEAQTVAKNIIYQHTGDGKQGRWIVVSSESGKIEGSDVVKNETQSEASFLELDKRTEEKIISSNQWDAILAGIHRSGSNNTVNSAYIRAIFDIKKATVITPAQNLMVSKFLKPLVLISNEFMGTKWNENDIALKTVMPISFLGDIDVNSILQINEGREIAGLPVVEEAIGKQFIKQSTKKEQKPAEKKGKKDV